MTLMKKADIVAMIRKDVNNHKTKIEAMESQNKELRDTIQSNLDTISSSKAFVTKYEPVITTGGATVTKTTRDYVKGNVPSGRKLTTKPKAKVRYRKDGSIDLRSYNRGRAAKGKAASVTITRRNKS